MPEYLFVMTVGSGFLILSFLFSEVFDFVGNIGEGFDNFLEGLGIDIFPDSVWAGDGGSATKPISMSTIAGFLAFLGGTGALLTYYSPGMPIVVSLPVSIGIGLVAAMAIWRFSVVIANQSASSEARQSDFIDAPGRISVPIPKLGTGEVTVVVRGQAQPWAARSDDSEEITTNTPVIVIAKEGGILTVKKA